MNIPTVYPAPSVAKLADGKMAVTGTAVAVAERYAAIKASGAVTDVLFNTNEYGVKTVLVICDQTRSAIL